MAETEIEKLDLNSMNISEEKRMELLRIFPEVHSEDGKIDFDKLKLALGEMIDVGKERYSINWSGKAECFKTIQSPSSATLVPAVDESLRFEESDNIFIEGDNLEVLKLLQKSYLNRVKVIFIDPPYNTGNELIYPDNFSENLQTYLEYTHQSDSQGKKFGTNLETDGRFHSKWLCMMYPRLYLANNLLSNEGCICVMISDVEYANLRNLMNDIFGEENYINTISVLTKVAAGASGGGEDKRLKKNIEYILIYAKNASHFNTVTHMYSGEPIAKVIREMKMNNESWKYTRMLNNYDDRELVGEIKDGQGEIIKVFRHKNYEIMSVSNAVKDAIKDCKSTTEEDMAVNTVYMSHFESIFRDTNAQSSIRARVMDYLGDEDGLFSIDYVPRSGRNKGQVTTVYYKGSKKDQIAWLKDICEKQGDIVIKKEKLGTLWADIDYNNIGKEGGIQFPNGKKPIQLIERCIDLVNGTDGIILDFFGGSCSTAHAVMNKNAQDNGTRKFIVIQLPEIINEKDDSSESLIKLCNEKKIPLNIAEIGKERIRRTIGEIEKKHPEKVAKNGFRVFKLAKSNFRYWKTISSSKDDLEAQLELHVDHIRQDRSTEDILYEILLKSGFQLSTKFEKINIEKKIVYSVAGGMLLICLEHEITLELIKTIAELKPERVVCLDQGFANNDQLKINADLIFKNKGIVSFKTV